MSTTPEGVPVQQYVESRAWEVDALQRVIGPIPRAVRQNVPIHMRRRAVSHNTKRLPRRLQHAANNDNSGALKTKRPPSKYRKRPKNLRKEYERRQQKVAWLPTHIWHAKRFHMKKLWRHWIPWTPCEKIKRSAYRSSIRGCLIQDISFMKCVEINGRQEDIASLFSSLTEPKTGVRITDERYTSGQEEGSVMLYNKCSEPMVPICYVTFMWRPCSENTATATERHSLWLWVHISDCVDLCNLLEKHVEKMNLLITATRIDDSLSRFRLTGPLSQAVVAKSLICPPLYEIQERCKQSPADASMEKAHSWWSKVMQGAELQSNHSDQHELWNTIDRVSSPDMLPPNRIIALNVHDPRLQVARKKHKAVTTIAESLNSDPEKVEELWKRANISHSLLWHKNLHEGIISARISDSEMNKYKSQQLVPGQPLDNVLSLVPVVLVQRPGYRLLSATHRRHHVPGHGCGWDVIIPTVWAKNLWISFVYCGARASGMQEAKDVSAEAGLMCYPHDFPDSATYQNLENMDGKQLQAVYGRKPPAKRPHYKRLCSLSPFIRPWQQLCLDWGGQQLKHTNFQVLRFKKELYVLQRLCEGRIAESTAIRHISNTCFKEHNQFTVPYVVCVDLLCLRRGTLSSRAMICVPSNEDLELLAKNPTYAGPVQRCNKRVKIPKTFKQARAKRLKKKHKVTLLDKQIAENLQSKKKVDKASESSNHTTTEEHIKSTESTEKKSSKPMEMGKSKTTENSTTQSRKRKHEQIEEDDDEEVTIDTSIPVRYSADREILGYVQHGGYQLYCGSGGGHGFVNLNGLLDLMRQQQSNNIGGRQRRRQCLVLIRGISSRQYRFAELKVRV